MTGVSIQVKHEAILILDFGGQYKQLIARRVRAQNVYCEVHSHRSDVKALLAAGYKGVILSGGPRSVNDADAPQLDPAIFASALPVLGICYGAQLMAKALGGEVSRADKREFGEVRVTVDPAAALFTGLRPEQTVWMSHADAITGVPEGFDVTARAGHHDVAAMEQHERKLYALQFHPEVTHTQHGDIMLAHFLFDVCGLSGTWQMASFVRDKIDEIRQAAGGHKVLSAMSGGVDSSVSSLLVHRAIGKDLTCIFVDHGLLRKNEAADVERIFRKRFDMNLIRIDAKDRFLKRLEGVTDSEQKRKIIGEEFIRVFEEEAKKIPGVEHLVQGTIYPDIIESGVGEAALIKSHHNVGGLPDDVDFKTIIEPLSDLFKDEVRQVGLELGIPEDLVWRQPFPGPGLGIRIMGEVTEPKLEILREADAIFREEIMRSSLQRDLGQYFAVLTGIRSVGVMGDGRTYDYTIALRAVTTSDFMTADWAKIPYELLGRISSRIVNEVKGVNRVVYDITSKPPATIEWE
ncbi:MAG TPA: glutamine-hydrolyzing GMP synthase [Clostridiaceae bacterium]|nr:glutamine-hydrolyzing GMP synthase [Clostridiaceae bacterium]